MQDDLFPTLPAAPAGGAPSPEGGPAARAAWLRSELERHTVLYYRDAAPEISDAEFDRMMAELAALERAHPELRTPNSPTQRVGGAPSEDREPFAHILPMQSLDNTYNRANLGDFDAMVRAITGLETVDYVVEPKIDGLAFCAVYEHGELSAASTRGDGTTGDNITADMRGIRSLPLRIPCDAERIEVRGEIFLPKSVFADMVDEATANPGIGVRPENPRNAASGLINGFGKSGSARSLSFELKRFQLEYRKRLSVVLYGLGYCRGFQEPSTHHELLAWIHKQGFPSQTTSWNCRGLEEVQRAIDDLERMRHAFPFEMDGAVIKVDTRSLYAMLGSTAKAPRWARAYKYAPEQAETVVEAITVQVGRTGVLTPVAELRTVFLAGSNISRATLHNEEDIHRKDIRIGDHVLIEKAGEVIPAVVSVLKEKRTGAELVWNMPDHCPKCGRPVSRTNGEVAIRCTNLLCPAQLQTRIEHFASPDALNLEGIGEDVAKALVEFGIRHPIDLFSILQDEWKNLRFDRQARKSTTTDQTETFGFYEQMETVKADGRAKLGDARAENIAIAIAKAKALPLSRWLFALGIPAVGKTVSNDVAKVHANLADLSHSTLVESALRLYALQDRLPSLSPNAKANRALGISARVAKAEEFERVSREVEELGEDLIRRGFGGRLKTGGPAAYTCVIKPEAARALHEYFKSDDGRYFLNAMNSLRINPVGELESVNSGSCNDDGKGPFTGQTIVLTGTFHDLKRRDVEKLLLAQGAKIVESVSRSTGLLVIGKNPGADKTTKAREFGIRTMDEAMLRKELGLPPVVEQTTLF